MAKHNTSVFGIVKTRNQAEACITALTAAGFRNEDISVLASDSFSTGDLVTEKSTKAPEGATTGAAAGGTLGGTIGLLAGIGAIAIPGVGPLIAAGPIMGALAGLGIGAATGGIVGALAGMGIPEYEAKRYEGHVRDGGILISVHGDDSQWVAKAKQILKGCGADDISSTSEKSVKKAS